MMCQLRSNNNQNTIQKYKPCAGKGCKKRGTHYLKIRFLKKFGWFCDSCKEFLIQNKLVDETDDAGNTGQILECRGTSKNE